ncbi:hypothetical protein Mal64_34420 [Pseudobythopirellula maris]|uniref:PEP-CTERM protein-sorting domain-containing protein n=1 Tax=Pseudobythopirellula maris TaxID=2527991 RepID=A0A5C5ZHN4_9BACT|nr:hypothetical protein [Pseudobythopirellula maris]TWT86615.1 hypothetical protein Mal64_34420 [Pseudobythopirellula maris]
MPCLPALFRCYGFAAAIVALLAMGPASCLASIQTYIDASAFDAAAQGLLYGMEDFENNSLGVTGAVLMDGPLSPSSTESPFGGGIGVPVAIQDNQGGAGAATPDPSPAAGLAVLKNFAWVTSTAVLFNSNSSNYSLDLIFEPSSLVLSVGFDTIVNASADLVTVTVFDTSNAVLGSYTGVDAAGNGTEFFGVVVGGGDYIGRINIAREGGGIAGVDDLSVYGATPEPAAILVWAGMMGVVASLRRGR